MRHRVLSTVAKRLYRIVDPTARSVTTRISVQTLRLKTTSLISVTRCVHVFHCQSREREMVVANRAAANSISVDRREGKIQQKQTTAGLWFELVALLAVISLHLVDFEQSVVSRDAMEDSGVLFSSSDKKLLLSTWRQWISRRPVWDSHCRL